MEKKEKRPKEKEMEETDLTVWKKMKTKPRDGLFVRGRG